MKTYEQARSILLRRAIRLWDRDEFPSALSAFLALCARYGVEA